jgi:hypothetical protein
VISARLDSLASGAREPPGSLRAGYALRALAGLLGIEVCSV